MKKELIIRRLLKHLENGDEDIFRLQKSIQLPNNLLIVAISDKGLILYDQSKNENSDLFWEACDEKLLFFILKNQELIKN